MLLIVEICVGENPPEEELLIQLDNVFFLRGKANQEPKKGKICLSSGARLR